MFAEAYKVSSTPLQLSDIDRLGREIVSPGHPVTFVAEWRFGPSLPGPSVALFPITTLAL